MRRTQHAARIVAILAVAAGWLGWLAAHTDILFADGLRYVAQAQRIDKGAWSDGLFGMVDHPIYPLEIAATHRALGGEGPESWQFAAQVASVIAGTLLMIPLYLMSRELFGDRSAWLSCALALAVPLTGHVLADVLSEGTFLLFWCWGVFSALRFLRRGAFGWLPVTIAFAALAYLSRPEGLLLPAGLVASLTLMPLATSTRMNWPRWRAAMLFLVVGPACVAGPFMASKGAVGTKPSVARLLGTAPKSPALAVERERPLEPDQTWAKTYGLAVKALAKALRVAVTPPLLILAGMGFALAWPPGDRSRAWLFLAVVVGASLAALIRLHATGGYCDARHAMIVALMLIAAAARGLDELLGRLTVPGRWIGLGEGRFAVGPAAWGVALAALVAWNADALRSPINAGFGGYRAAGSWIAAASPGESSVVDVTGWSQYYSRHPGYTFANLTEGTLDPNARWAVVREAHLNGPWGYCDQLRALVAGLEPVASFPPVPARQQAQVYVFDLAARPDRVASAAARRR